MHSLENERFIRLLLLDKSNKKEISAEVVRNMLLHASSRGEDLISQFNFLMSLGSFKEAIEYLESFDWESAHTPISLLLCLISKANQKIEFEDDLEFYLRTHSRTQYVSLFAYSQIKNTSLKDMFRAHFKTLKAQHEQRFKKLTEQLDFYKSQRMWKDQRDVIEKLVREFPESKQTKEFQKTFNEIWAIEKIEQVLLEKGEVHFESIKPTVTTEESEMLDVIFSSAMELVVSQRYTPVDFAMMFYFFDAPHLGLEFLKTDIKPASHLWLEAELLFVCGRFVDVLLVLRTLQEKSQNDPEMQFSVSYLRAQCFWKLGQKKRAKELISDILKVRPDYRSAKSLQMNWNNSDE